MSSTLMTNKLERFSLAFTAVRMASGLYYKTLRIGNLRQIDWFRSKIVASHWSVTNMLAWTTTLAYYGSSKLRIRNILWFRPQRLQNWSAPSLSLKRWLRWWANYLLTQNCKLQWSKFCIIDPDWLASFGLRSTF